jgi:hypothetical protein
LYHLSFFFLLFHQQGLFLTTNESINQSAKSYLLTFKERYYIFSCIGVADLKRLPVRMKDSCSDALNHFLSLWFASSNSNMPLLLSLIASLILSFLLDEHLSDSQVPHEPHPVRMSSRHLPVYCFDQPIPLTLSIVPYLLE